MTTPEQPLRSTRRWLRLSIGLMTLLVIVLLALPEAGRWGAQRWLNQQPGLTAQIEDIDLNLFSGTLQVDQLLVERGTEVVLSAKRALVQVDWWPLLHRHLQLRQVQLEQGRLLIEQLSGQSLTVAGLVLAAGNSEAEPDVLLESAAPPEPEAKPWGINSGVLALQQFEVIIRTDQQDMAVKIDQLAGSPVISWQPQQANSFDVALSVAGGTIRLLGESQPFAEPNQAEVELRMDKVDLATLEPLLTSLGWSEGRGVLTSRLNLKWLAVTDSQPAQLAIDGSFAAADLAGSQAAIWLRQLGINWDGHVDVQLNDAGPALKVDGQLQLDGLDVDLLESGMRIQPQQLQWHGTLATSPEQVTDEGDTTTSLTVAGLVNVDQLQIVDLNLDETLLTLGQLRLPKFSVLDNGLIELEQLSLQQLSLLQRKAAAKPRTAQVLHLAQLDCDQLAFNPEEWLAVGALQLQGLQADLVRLSTGAMELHQWLPVNEDSEEGPSSAKSQEDESQSSPLAISLAQLKVDGDSWVRFEDQGASKPVALALEPLSLSLANVDSRKPTQASPLSFQAKLDQYSQLNINGQVAPFAEQANFDVSGSLKEFQLPTVSPYVEQAIGYRLEQGHLNLDFTLPVTQGQMDLNSDLHLRQLRMAAMSAEDEAAAGERLGLPVNMALSLLRDTNGDIFLKLPVAGDLDDPNVEIGPILRKALRGTVQNTVMLTLAPLGIVAKAGQLVGIGDALNFEPLHCVLGEATLSAASQSQLEKVRQLLKERPQLTMSLCGHVTQADLVALQALQVPSPSTTAVAAPTAGADKDKPQPVIEISPEQRLALAQQRAEAVKAALVATGEVKPSQLLLCNPSAELSDKVSGVVISL